MRAVKEIAKEIQEDWVSVNDGAVPYLECMHSISKVSDMYGHDTGKSIVLYFLANTNTWRGDTARRIKNELRNLLNNKY